jgi:hypothetical protein
MKPVTASISVTDGADTSDVMTSAPVTASISVTDGPDIMPPPGPPHTYIGIAYCMLQGVRVLAEASPLPALPLAMVSAHVLECALKAYLSRSGDDARVKRADIRHNLNALWSLAHAEGLNIQREPPEWASVLSHVHDQPYYLRYSTGVNGLVTPAPEPMATELSAVVDQVQTQL